MFELKYGAFVLRGKELPFSLRSLARRSFWEPFADFSLVLLFGLFGAVYLRRQDGSRAGFWAFPGLVAFSLWLQDPLFVVSSLLAGIAGFLLVALFAYAALILQGVAEKPGVSVFLPYRTEAGELGVTFLKFEEVIFIPISYFVLALATILIGHEALHGLLVVAQGLRVRSVGLASLGLIPLFAFCALWLVGKVSLDALPLALIFAFLPIAAFVEPEDLDFKRATSLQRVRVYAVGSMANFCLAALAFLFGVLLFHALATFELTGVQVLGVAELEGRIVLEIDGKRIHNPEAFRELVASAHKEVLLRTDKGLLVVQRDTLLEAKVRGYVDPRFTSWLQLLFSVGFLNLCVGLVNLIPLPVLDGGRIAYEFVSVLMGTKAGLVYRLVVALALILVGINALPLLK